LKEAFKISSIFIFYPHIIPNFFPDSYNLLVFRVIYSEISCELLVQTSALGMQNFRLPLQEESFRQGRGIPPFVMQAA
jgi:hypothetical protein